ncbi:MAG: hypothetical protein ACJ763_12430 [Bdellovibrionia bacterium]
MNPLFDMQATVANWLVTAQAQVGNATNGFGGSKNSMMAGSPFTDYTGAVVIYVIAIGALVAILLIGGLLVVNLGLMSKRAEDRTGNRTPSDVGILKDTLWPQEGESRTILPAEDDGQGGQSIAAQFASQQPPHHNVNTHFDIAAERRKREEWSRTEKAAEIREDRQEDRWEHDEMERRGRSERPPFDSGNRAA